jgi:hypothetical protein
MSRWRTAGAVAVALAFLAVVELAAPAPAQAFSLNPADWVVDGFKAILEYIFGDADKLAGRIVTLLLAVPLLGDEQAFPRLNAYREYVTWGAWAVLGLMFVIASVRYYLSSFSGNGAWEALTGLARGVGAICLLLAFEPAFDLVTRSVNAFTAALIDNPVIGSGLGNGVVRVVGTSSFDAGGVAMIISIVAIIVALILVLIKVVVVSLLAVLYVASPLAIALWPLEEMAWAMRSCLQAIMGLLAFPILWALCFGTFAVLTTDALFPGDHGDLLNAVLAPLIGLASLIVAFKLPFSGLGQAMKAGVMPSSQRAARVVRTVRDRVPAGRDGARAPRSPRPREAS